VGASGEPYGVRKAILKAGLLRDPALAGSIGVNFQMRRDALGIG
jgi:hypothetical protein